MPVAFNNIHVVHSITVQLRQDAEGNLSTYIDPSEGIPIHEAQGLLTRAILKLDEEYPG